MTGLATSRVFVSSANETYSYDGAGNFVSTTYSGDTHGRLATMTGTTGVSPVGGGNTGTTGVSPVPSNTFAYSYLPGTDDFDNSAGGGFAELEVSAVVSDGTNDLVSVATNRVFVPPANETYAYDADGNQTLVTTGTGAWQVEYNGENRPVKWTRVSPDSPTPNSFTPTLISMAFDHQGRRRLYVEVAAGVTNKLHRFTYDDYVCIARNREVDAQHGIGSDAFVWDPTEPIATRPLMCAPSTETPFLYCHDGNKNVSETVSLYGTIAAHYEYSSFGKVVLVTSENEDQITANLNPYRFSSEYADDAFGLVYYNYRHYNPKDGRWMGRDPREDIENLIRFINNSPVVYYDFCGLSCSKINGIGAELSASGSLYAGIGGSVSVSLSSTVYNCCCDGKIYQSDAYDVSLTLRGSIGFGVGGRINLPIMGSVGMEVLGPQYAVSGGILYSKDCGEADPEFSVTLVDVSGEIGGSFNVGSMFGASISYWTKYSLSVVAIVHGRSVDFSVNRGWHGGGSSTIYTPAGNINIEFSLYDYQSPLCKDNNIMTLTW